MSKCLQTLWSHCYVGISVTFTGTKYTVLYVLIDANLNNLGIFKKTKKNINIMYELKRSNIYVSFVL